MISSFPEQAGLLTCGHMMAEQVKTAEGLVKQLITLYFFPEARG